MVRLTTSRQLESCRLTALIVMITLRSTRIAQHLVPGTTALRNNSTKIQKVWTWTKMKQAKPVKLRNKLSTNCTHYGSMWNMDARQEAVTHTSASVFSRNPGSASLHTRRDRCTRRSAHTRSRRRCDITCGVPKSLTSMLGTVIYDCRLLLLMLLLPLILIVIMTYRYHY